jgi:glycosyltransferase involved in cell wall biosynthesis
MSKTIAIIGSRGIPAKYGGFETFVEEISTKLVDKGYTVYVSCEEGTLDEYKGVKLIYFPTRPFFRLIYEVIYDIYFLIKTSLFCDQIYILGIGAGFVYFIPRLFGKKILVNPDGMEWRRDKFSKVEKLILYLDSICAIKFANTIVADSRAIKDYIAKNRNKNATFIPYGVFEQKLEKWEPDKLKCFSDPNPGIAKLRGNDYYLIVARLEPENNIHNMVEGFLLSTTNRQLVIVGTFLSKRYQSMIYDLIKRYSADGRIIFTGSIYKKDILNMLRQNCFIYLHGHSVGGTNPSLLEAMIMKNIIVAHNNEFNREVGEECLIYFDTPQDLSVKINLVENNIAEYSKLKDTAYLKAKKDYDWNSVVNAYDKLFGDK